MADSTFIGFLDRLFESCGQARLEKNSLMWFDVLSVITLNLSTEMSAGQLSACEILKGKVQPLVSDFDSEDELLVIDSHTEDLLCSWEILLRKVRKDAGLQQNIKVIRSKFS